MPSQLLKEVNFPEPGRYVVAVSGGVDSAVLLDLLAARKELELVVAHFDHGTRPDSARDRRFVKKLAKNYGLKFVSRRGRLGARASEARARTARYRFLFSCQARYAARAVVTAHHLDDRIETSVFNALRGSGLSGLLGVKPTAQVKRPLLALSKAEIHTYAKTHGLAWREDPTNRDLSYARNFIRRLLLPVARNQNSDLTRYYHQRLQKLEKRYVQKSKELAEFQRAKVKLEKNELSFRRLHLAQESKATQLSLLRYLIDQLAPVEEVSARNLSELRRFALTARPGKVLKLPQLRALSHHDKVSLRIK